VRLLNVLPHVQEISTVPLPLGTRSMREHCGQRKYLCSVSRRRARLLSTELRTRFLTR
jgi:hypothetical protein